MTVELRSDSHSEHLRAAETLECDADQAPLLMNGR